MLTRVWSVLYRARAMATVSDVPPPPSTPSLPSATLPLPLPTTLPPSSVAVRPTVVHRPRVRTGQRNTHRAQALFSDCRNKNMTLDAIRQTFDEAQLSDLFEAAHGQSAAHQAQMRYVEYMRMGYTTEQVKSALEAESLGRFFAGAHAHFTKTVTTRALFARLMSEGKSLAEIQQTFESKSLGPWFQSTHKQWEGASIRGRSVNADGSVRYVRVTLQYESRPPFCANVTTAGTLCLTNYMLSTMDHPDMPVHRFPKHCLLPGKLDLAKGTWSPPTPRWGSKGRPAKGWPRGLKILGCQLIVEPGAVRSNTPKK